MNPVVAIFSGGVSGEKEVSRRSAAAVAEALADDFPVEVFEIDRRSLPRGLHPGRHVVFSLLHGVFGEDGGMQRLLEAAGFHFTGSGSAGSGLCMNKEAAKETVAAAGVEIPRGMLVHGGNFPEVGSITAALGRALVIKPNCEGSSLGLHFASGARELSGVLKKLEPGDWLVEEKIEGREFTVGLLHGKALGVVEILPDSGVFDYRSKYTPGMTRYLFPAPLGEKATRRIREWAETAFRVCGCRDFARADFMLSASGRVVFLEMNTIPGLTETSLLPKSAACLGMDFPTLARGLVMPAIRRFQHTHGRIAS